MIEQEISIRKMEINDIPNVYNLGKTIFIEEKSREVSYVYNFWTLKSLVIFLENYTDLAFVAIYHNEIVGFVLGHPNYEDKLKTGWIEWIAIDKDYRRKGIGIKLIDRILESYKNKGIKKIVTDVKTINKSSIGLFKEKFHFKEVESIVFLEANFEN